MHFQFSPLPTHHSGEEKDDDDSTHHSEEDDDSSTSDPNHYSVGQVEDDYNSPPSYQYCVEVEEGTDKPFICAVRRTDQEEKCGRRYKRRNAVNKHQRMDHLATDEE